MYLSNLTKLFGFIFLLSICFSCGDDEVTGGGGDTEEPKARFTPVQDESDPFTFMFVNESINASTYSWDFGDGMSSTEEAPSHTYVTEGDYTVQLTASEGSQMHVSSVDISVTDPNTQLKKITGATSKTWKLLRDISDGENFPMQVGPEDRSQIWWAYGLNDPIGSRTCLMEEEYIFSLDGSYEYKTDGNVFADFGIWADDLAGVCVDENDPSMMVNTDGADISAWKSNTYSFEFDNANNTLALNGLGAHVALPKVGTDAEYNTPQLGVTYNIVELQDNDGVDRMILETTIPGGYWRFVLVSYDDPSTEPELPGAPPTVGFNPTIEGSTVTFNNTTANADSYAWDFGDGGMSAEESPTHTYAMDGAYTVTLTATNADGSSTATTEVIISSSTFTAATLNGAGQKVWKLNPAAGALSVGPGKGSGEWFATTEDDVVGRDCAFDDEYIFTDAGEFNYDAKGAVFAEPYMGVTDAGCVDEATLMGGAEAWASGNHAYTIAEGAGDNPSFITVKGTGAFIALPKAFNGGEHLDASTIATDGEVTYEVLSYVNDGTSEILQITLDISEGQVGGAWWTFTLISQ